jgi:IS4 transposase
VRPYWPHLAAEGATFYVRLKAGRFVELEAHSSDSGTNDDENSDVDASTEVVRTMIKHLKDKDAVISLYGLTLRVIRSPKDGESNEPWYILTNDMSSSRTRIVRIYYHRFEIEESFKDVKHIFEFRRTRLNKPNSLKVVL